MTTAKSLIDEILVSLTQSNHTPEEESPTARQSQPNPFFRRSASQLWGGAAPFVARGGSPHASPESSRDHPIFEDIVAETRSCYQLLLLKHKQVEEQLQRRPRSVGLAANQTSSELTDTAIAHAAHPEEQLAQSTAALAAIFEAINTRDWNKVNDSDAAARLFLRRESELNHLLNSGVLVAL